MLKKPASFVLSLARILNVPQRVRLRFLLRLRPCWTDFLSILRDLFRCPICALAIEFSRAQWFSAACRSSIEAQHSAASKHSRRNNFFVISSG